MRTISALILGSVAVSCGSQVDPAASGGAPAVGSGSAFGVGGVGATGGLATGGDSLGGNLSSGGSAGGAGGAGGSEKVGGQCGACQNGGSLSASGGAGGAQGSGGSALTDDYLKRLYDFCEVACEALGSGDGCSPAASTCVLDCWGTRRDARDVGCSYAPVMDCADANPEVLKYSCTASGVTVASDACAPFAEEFNRCVVAAEAG